MKAGDQVFVLEVDYEEPGFRDHQRVAGATVWHATYEFKDGDNIQVRRNTLCGHKHVLVSKGMVFANHASIIKRLYGEI